MKKNYYQDLIEIIKNYIDKKDYKSALVLINEELNVPYVPIEIENELSKFSKQITNNLQEELKNNSYTWNLSKVVEVLSQKNDQELHLVAFEALRNLNIRQILNEIKDYLKDKDIKNEYKSFLMFILIEQSIDEDFIVYKDCEQKKIIFNPLSFDMKTAKNYLLNIELQIEKLIYHQNPGLFTICKHIANAYFYNIFPEFNSDQIHINDVIVFIIMLAKKSLEGNLNNQIDVEIDYNYDNVLYLIEKYQNII